MGHNEHIVSSKRTLMPEERRHYIERLVIDAGGVTGVELQEKFGVSQMTVRRDLDALESEGKVRRIYGGAVPPGVGGHEDSFRVRLEEAVETKKRLANAAMELVQPGENIFVDGSTTAYYTAAQMIAENFRATLLTNLIPIMDLFQVNEAPNLNSVGIGGSLRKLTQTFVGPQAVSAVRSYFTDRVLLSVKGVTPAGNLTDPDPLEAEVKRAMIECSEESVLLLDDRKFERRGLSVIGHVSELSEVLVVDAPESRIATLREAGARARLV